MAKSPAQKRLSVLVVTYGLPYPPHSGARARDFYLLREIARRHTVTCVCLLEPQDRQEGIQALERFNITAHGFRMYADSVATRARALLRHIMARRPLATYALWNGQMFESLRRLMATRQFDLVQIEHSIMMTYRDAVPAAYSGKLVLDLHNVGAQQYRRMRALQSAGRERVLFWLKSRLMQNWEVKHAARFDRVLAVSEYDASWLSAHNPALQVHVIENGVDTEEQNTLPETPDGTLLFVGTLGYPPNADGAGWFCGEILPLIRQRRPGVQVVIAGRTPRVEVRALAKLPGVQVCENVNDVAPFYSRAQVVVVPLRAGGGTRLKILEAMAFGRAVVSTRIGSEGLAVSDGETILLADTPQEFATAVVRLVLDGAERKRLAQNARALVEARYAWKQIGAKLLRLYDDLCE